MKCEVLLIPHYGLTDECIITIGNRVAFRIGEQFYNPYSGMYKANHLYIVSDEDITIGDDFIYDGKYILTCSGYSKGRYYTNDNNTPYIEEKCDKLIASTEPQDGLPTPDKTFVDKYIKRFKELNPITDVEVEITHNNTVKIKLPKDCFTHKKVLNSLHSFVDDNKKDDIITKLNKELEHQKTINKSLFNKNKLLNDTIDGLEANDLNKKLKDYSEKYHKLVVKYNALLTVNKTLLNIKNIDVTSIGSIDYFQQKVNVNETTIKFLKEEINALYYNLRKKDIKLEIMQGHNDKLRRTRKSLKQEVEHFKAVIQSLKKYHNQSN